MKEVILNAKKRSVIGKQVRRLRREGELPGVIYGHNQAPVPISLDFREASHILPYITGSHLITVNVEGEEYAALFKEKQRHPVHGTLTHVDFFAVSLTEKLHANVKIEITGDAPAVKDFGGILVTGLEEIEVYCLPKELPEKVVIDVSKLEKIGSAIHVKDLVFSDRIEILTNEDVLVVFIAAPVGEEIEPASEIEATIEPEVIEKGKKEEEDY